MKKEKPVLKRYDYAIQRLMTSMWLSLPHLKTYPRPDPSAGDLVMLFAAAHSEWHLSLYVQLESDGRHLIESVKTGALCYWDNVDIVVISREWVNENPRIKWSDAQFDFSRKIDAEGRRIYDQFYLYVPFIKTFDSSEIILGVRTKYGITEEKSYSAPINWMNISRAELRCILHELVRLQIELGKPQKATPAKGTI